MPLREAKGKKAASGKFLWWREVAWEGTGRQGRVEKRLGTFAERREKECK